MSTCKYTVNNEAHDLLIKLIYFLFFPGVMISGKTTQDWQCICATFPPVPVVALTATASRSDVAFIKQSLNLKTPFEIIANPNRRNIFYEKVFRKGEDVDFFVQLLKPIVDELKDKTVTYPLTVLYLPLKWCGFAFKYFERNLGADQYYPSTAVIT